MSVLILFQVVLLFAQDGSDINYVKPEQLDKSYLGRTIQIDFYRRSFYSSLLGDGARAIDKVFLEIGGKRLEFVEHRKDDGYNNWFSQQYLVSVDKKIKIKEFELLEIEKETIKVKGFLNVDPFTKKFIFKKNEIAEFLIKAK